MATSTSQAALHEQEAGEGWIRGASGRLSMVQRPTGAFRRVIAADQLPYYDAAADLGT